MRYMSSHLATLQRLFALQCCAELCAHCISPELIHLPWCCPTSVQVPVLVQAYGQQLPSLLDAQRALRLSTAGSSDGGDARDKTQ